MNNFSINSFLSYLKLKKQILKDNKTDLKLSSVEKENLFRFSLEAERIQNEIGIVSDLLTDLEILHVQTKSANSNKTLLHLRNCMDLDISTILSKSNIINSRLEALDQANISNRTLSPSFSGGSIVDHRRLSVTNGLRANLRYVVNEIQTLRGRIVAEHMNGLKRRYISATGETATADLITKMLSESNHAELFRENPDLGVEILERNTAVSNILQSLEQLQKVFRDMTAVTETLGKQLEDTQQNVAHTSNETDPLVSAQAKGSKNISCSVYIMVMVLFMVMLLVLLGLSLRRL